MEQALTCGSICWQAFFLRHIRVPDMPKINSIRIHEISPLPAENTGGEERAAVLSHLEWAKKRGVDVEHRQETEGTAIPGPFPVTVVDGVVALSGRYPTREEIGIWMMFGLVSAEGMAGGGIKCCTL